MDISVLLSRHRTKRQRRGDSILRAVGALVRVNVVMVVMMTTWPMMMVRVPIDDLGLRWRAATIHRDAVAQLQLDRRMLNTEVVFELVVDPLDQGVAIFH